MFIHFDNRMINLDCVKSINYAEATMEDLILDNLTASEIAKKCDNIKITFYFLDGSEEHFYIEKDFLNEFKAKLQSIEIKQGESDVV